MYIDDFWFAVLFSCDFDSTFGCNLDEEVVDKTGREEIKWHIGQGGTPTYKTGPSSDQSGTPGGKYALFESSFPTKTDQQAR